ncbi:MAG TPA: SIR2 family protein, partial [Longimicrobium sp.]|nr:SIR2 family protein [Longimicrobium sp.]
GIDPTVGATGPSDLVRRGNRAVRLLTRRDDRAFIDAMRATLYRGRPPVPPQTDALARIWWPLVLTTNYDDHFARAYARRHQDARDALTVLGRSAQDCQQVLSSLSSTSGCLLWALQGYLAAGRSEHPLHPELVVGHEEYRRVTHTAQHFRRAFAEVFRRRSFLFLGSSLGDTYLLDLFGEILEFAGANPLPHYAMVKRGTVDAPFLRSRFNIIALQYDEYDELPGWLDTLKAEIDRAGTRPVRWCYSLAAGDAAGQAPEVEDLEIVRGALTPPAEGEVLAVSAGTGKGGLLWVSEGSHETVRPFWSKPVVGRGYRMERLSPRFVFGYLKPDGPVPVVAVNARVDDRDKRDLRLISEAVWELLDWAAANGFHTVRMQVLASGKSAHYPARFSLAEAVRAYGRWRRATGHALALRIHLMDPRALLEVGTGRLDVVELLTCEDVRFWVEVVDGGQVLERELVFADCDDALSSIAERFDVPRTGWAVDVNPRPRLGAERLTVESAWDTDLLSIGVIPGATLRFLAADPQPAPAAESAAKPKASPARRARKQRAPGSSA